MRSDDCIPRLVFPRIAFPSELTSKEKSLAKKLAAEFNRLTLAVDRKPRTRHDECGVVGSLRRHLDALGPVSRAAALSAAGKQSGIAPGSATGSLQFDPGLLTEAQRMMRRRLAELRGELKKSIDEVLVQAGKVGSLFPATVVDFRMAGESIAKWHRHTQIASPESLTCRWSSGEPLADRAYFELRGPLGPGNPGKILAVGFLPDVLSGDDVGGYFELNLGAYLPAQPPQVAHRYHLRVLPLGAAQYGAAYGPNFGFTVTPLEDFEPTPPDGIGPWSLPAVIEYGKTFAQGPQQLDIDTVVFYRKARVQLDWFKVDEDQSGPGAEEYRVRAFMVEHNNLGSREYSQYGGFFSIPEGDRKPRPLNWNADIVLGDPWTNVWPRAFIIGMSVMEEDAGAQLDDWYAAITETVNEVLEGAFAGDIRALLREIRDEIDQATLGFRAGLSSAVVAFLVAAIGATVAKFVFAWIVLVIALVAAFIGAGSRDDFFGFHLYTLLLMTNDAELFAVGEGAEIFNSKAVVAGGVFAGEEVNGRFFLDPTEIQFFGSGLPDSASNADGIVRIGLHWEFYDKVIRNV